MTCSKCSLPKYCKGLCRKCYFADYYATNKSEISTKRKPYAKAYYESNKAAIKVRYAAWHEKNKDRKNEAERARYHRNRDAQLKRGKTYRANNKAAYNAVRKLRKEKIKQATPKWVDKESLKQIYVNRPAGCHVDHIVPLKGKGVCGLHVPWNLQYLPSNENIKKGNKF